jgi:hypothetical protein
VGSLKVCPRRSVPKRGTPSVVEHWDPTILSLISDTPMVVPQGRSPKSRSPRGVPQRGSPNGGHLSWDPEGGSHKGVSEGETPKLGPTRVVHHELSLKANPPSGVPLGENILAGFPLGEPPVIPTGLRHSGPPLVDPQLGTPLGGPTIEDPSLGHRIGNSSC